MNEEEIFVIPKERTLELDDNYISQYKKMKKGKHKFDDIIINKAENTEDKIMNNNELFDNQINSDYSNNVENEEDKELNLTISDNNDDSKLITKFFLY